MAETVHRFSLESTPENIDALAQFFRRHIPSEEVRWKIVEWASTLYLLSDSIEIDELGMVWAGPERADTLIERAKESAYRELGVAIAQAIPKEDRYFELQIMACPEIDFYWPVNYGEPGSIDEETGEPYYSPREGMREEYREVLEKLHKGATREEAIHDMVLPTITPHKDKVTAYLERDKLALHPIIPGNLTPADSIPNIDAAAEEKLRITETMDSPDGHIPRKGLPQGVMPHFWASTLVWVSEEMGQVVREAARTLPHDWAPDESDFGILPNNTLVMFAGGALRFNILHANMKNGGRMGLLPMRAGFDALSGWQEDWYFGKTLAENVNPHYRLWWAFCLIANEPIAAHHKERPSRATVRRAQRALKRDPSDIVVVTLRRPRHEKDDPEHHRVDWSHSWIVNAHWRNQWYPSLNRHKPKFIYAYTKGEGPLIVKGRIFRVAR